jgi:HPt (histidine-containing phosphotransfer) domain-containing protein
VDLTNILYFFLIAVIVGFIYLIYLIFKENKITKTKEIDNFSEELKKKELLRQEEIKKESEKKELLRQEEIKKESEKKELLRQEEIKKESEKKELNKEINEVNKILSPNKIYPDFNIENPMNELGMDSQEVKEFLVEFIDQVIDQRVEIIKNIEVLNIENLEKLTHSIKGSSSSLRINGIGDCIAEFNNYLRRDDCKLEEIIKYMNDFDYYLEKFKNDENIK